MWSTSMRKSGSSAASAEKSSTTAGAINLLAGTDATSSLPFPVTQWLGASKCVPVCSPLRKLFQYQAGPRSSYLLISSSSNLAVCPNSGGSVRTGVVLESGAVRSTISMSPEANAETRAERVDMGPPVALEDPERIATLQPPSRTRRASCRRSCAGLRVRLRVDRVLLPARGAQVPLADHEPEQEVVDRRVDQADRQQQQRLVGDAEVQHVVDRSCREAEPMVDVQCVDERHRGSGEQRMDHVERPGDEDERELDRFRHAGQEGHQRGGAHDAEGRLLLARLRLVGDRQRSGRQREHHDREEAGHKDPRTRVTGEEASQVTVGALELPHLEPQQRVEDVVQPERDQKTIDDTEDAATDDRASGQRLTEVGQQVVEDRVQQAQRNAEHDSRERGDDRHETPPAEESEIVRQLDPVVPLPQDRSGDTDQDAAEDAVVDGLLLCALRRSPVDVRRHRGEHAVEYEVPDDRRQRRRPVGLASEPDGDTYREDDRQVVED